jgi:hypothetical protein
MIDHIDSDNLKSAVIVIYFLLSIISAQYLDQYLQVGPKCREQRDNYIPFHEYVVLTDNFPFYLRECYA